MSEKRNRRLIDRSAWVNWLNSISERTVAVIMAITGMAFVITVVAVSLFTSGEACFARSGTSTSGCGQAPNPEADLVLGIVAPIVLAVFASAYGVWRARPVFTLVSTVVLAAAVIVLRFVIWR